MRTMAAGEFKAKCLAVMDEVNSTGKAVLDHEARQAAGSDCIYGGGTRAGESRGDLWQLAAYGHHYRRYCFIGVHRRRMGSDVR